jgi:hypothetical protein
MFRKVEIRGTALKFLNRAKVEIKDPSLEIKWLKFDVCQEAEELKIRTN